MEEWRNGGIGKALFKEMKRWFLQNKVQAIELYVSFSNPDATAFWREMGLEPFLQLMHQDI
jgi:GNAT superfamily N-acetyltransferase